MTAVDDRPIADLQAWLRAATRTQVGTFASFAVGFSFVSILTTVFQLFGLGFGSAARVLWTWPAVFAGQMAGGAVLRRAGRPLSAVRGESTSVAAARRCRGRLVRRLDDDHRADRQLAAAAIALQVVLPVVWSGFQLIGTDSSLGSVSGAGNAVVSG